MTISDVLAPPGMDMQLVGATTPVAFHRFKAASKCCQAAALPINIWRQSERVCSSPEEAEGEIMRILRASTTPLIGGQVESLLDRLFILCEYGKPRATPHSDRGPVANPLDLAVEKRLRPIIPLLRHRGYQLELLDAYSIERPVSNNDVELVSAYLEAGINVDIRANAGRSLLQVAISFKCKETMELLMKWKADIHQPTGFGNWTCLMWAAHVGWRDGCERLIVEGSDTQATNSQGQTALQIACMRGQSEVVALLEGHST